MLFDFASQRWKDFAALPHIGSPQWSKDSECLYIDGFDKEVVRVQRTDGKLERILDLKTVDANALLCYFSNLTSDGDVLLSCPLARGDMRLMSTFHDGGWLTKDRRLGLMAELTSLC